MQRKKENTEKTKMVDFVVRMSELEKKMKQCKKHQKKKIILRRCERERDADDGVCGNDGGDAFDTDSQHVYNLQIYYTKLIHSESLLL